MNERNERISETAVNKIGIPLWVQIICSINLQNAKQVHFNLYIITYARVIDIDFVELFIVYVKFYLSFDNLSWISVKLKVL